MLFSLIGGIAATLSAMDAMLDSQFSLPCYAGLFSSELLNLNNKTKDFLNNTTLITA